MTPRQQKEARAVILARIAALEAKDEQLYRYITAQCIARIAALEGETGPDAWQEHMKGHGVLEQKIATLEETVKAVASDIAAILGSRITAPPPAPEERCAVRGGFPVVQCVLDRGHKETHRWPPPAPPAQAQETFRNSGKRVFVDAPPERAQEKSAKCPWDDLPVLGLIGSMEGLIYEHANGVKHIHTRAPSPEQARRTFENVSSISHQKNGKWIDDELIASPDIPLTLVQLRPGERIVSGEVVRCHKWQNGRIYMCDGPGCSGVEHGTYYPDAPPRAEEG